MTPRSRRIAPWQVATIASTIGISAIAVLLNLADAPPTLTFAVAALATIGLAWMVGLSTEQLAATSSPKVSALLNAAFGNIAELVLVLIAVSKGLTDVAIASIAGSVIGNALFVLGAAFLIGGLRHGVQRFSREIAGLNSVLLVVAVMGIGIPTAFATFSGADAGHVQGLSSVVAVIFLLLYGGYLWSFMRAEDQPDDLGHPPELVPWSRTAAISVLLVSGVGVGILGEVLVGSLEPAAQAMDLSPVFMGLIAIPVIGNLAEHLVAVQLAWRGRMDFAVNIAMGSTIQVVMFLAPVIVLVSPLLGHQVPLVFTALEVIALAGGAIVIGLVSNDGESTWVEGAALVAVYLMVAAAAYLWPVAGMA